MSLSTIDIVPLAIEYRQSIINLLLSSFFVQEPLNASLKFDLPREPLSWIEHIIDGALRDQCSFVAVDTTNPNVNVVGVILNSISRRDDQHDDFVTPSEKFQLIFSLMDEVSRNVNLFNKFQTDRLFHCDVINIDEKQRGQNLSSQLISTSLDKARQLGVQAAVVVCSSLFSRKAFIRHGFEVINEILYAQHNGGRLHDMGVHDRCTLLAKKL